MQSAEPRGFFLFLPISHLKSLFFFHLSCLLLLLHVLHFQNIFVAPRDFVLRSNSFKFFHWTRQFLLRLFASTAGIPVHYLFARHTISCASVSHVPPLIVFAPRSAVVAGSILRIAVMLFLLYLHMIVSFDAVNSQYSPALGTWCRGRPHPSHGS